MLNAGQECMLSTFDLRDYFDVSMVGTYGLSMVVDPRATLPDINGSLKFTVTSR
jgi:hypothetical protein